MAYREITLPSGEQSTTTFKYIVGRYQTKIVGIGIFNNASIGHCTDVSMDVYRVTPNDIERAIKSSSKCPPLVSDPFPWDKPVQAPKKVDPGPKTRGFVKLLSKNFVYLDASCLNEVILEDGLGCQYRITAEVENQIPVLRCTAVTKS
jgi:hypothetical protein